MQGVLRGDYDGASDLAPFLAYANLIVTRVCACAAAKGVTLSSAELEMMERWLAAHAYGSTASNDRPVQEQQTEKASGRFQGRTDKGLESTYYGQMALAADPSGCLAAITKRHRPAVGWLGKNPTDQTPYEDRR